jgi:ribonuclease HI
MSELQEVIIYTRGISDWSGTGGYAAILLFGIHRKEISGSLEATTNNRMDLLASIEGLKALKSKCRVKVYNNNLYLVESMVKGWVQRWRESNWRTKENEKTANSDLWEQLLDISAQHEVEFVWLKKGSHAKDFDCCDRLAHQVIKTS